jgi:hypothetical protein
MKKHSRKHKDCYQTPESLRQTVSDAMPKFPCCLCGRPAICFLDDAAFCDMCAKLAKQGQ